MNAIRRQIAAGACLALLPFAGTARAADDYQAHCLYLGEAPSGETNWSPGVKGLAHDDANWYITQWETLWRVPVGLDLDSISAGSPGVLRRTTFPEDDEWYFGDPCVYRYNGADYLIVGYEGRSFGEQYFLVAVFNAGTLTAIDRVNVPTHIAHEIGVDELGNLYLSQISGAGFVGRWTVDWAELQPTGNLTVRLAEAVTLHDEFGGELSYLPGGVSGLELTADGRYLYVGADDIHIFDMQSHRRIHRSTNSTSGYFPFNWDTAEEFPLGLTLWDLEGTGSPHLGQLHVIVRDPDLIGDDDVFLKHYTARIRVQAGAPAPWSGTPWDPFPTVAAAASAAWLGSEIRIDAGVYNETITIDQRVRLKSVGGTTRIGN